MKIKILILLFVFLISLMTISVFADTDSDLVDSCIFGMHFDNATGDFCSDNIGTENGDVYTEAACKSDDAGCFDGDKTSDYIAFSSVTGNALKFADPDEADDITCSMWINPDAPSGSGQIFSTNAGSGSNTGMGLAWGEGGEKLYARIIFDDTNTQYSSPSGWTLHSGHTGVWKHHIIEWDTTKNEFNHSINLETFAVDTSSSGSAGSSTQTIGIGATISGSSKFGGQIQALYCFDRVLTNTEKAYLYNSGDSKIIGQFVSPPPAPPDEQTFTITAKDLYDDSNINNLTITISNSSNKYTYSTQNGTILVSNKTNLQISKFNVTYNIKFSSSQAGGYLNNTHDINLTDGGNFTDKLYQAILYINASEVFSGSGIDEFWALSPLQINKSNSTGWTKLLLSAGSYNISANSTGYLDNKKSIDIAALSTNYENIVFGSANLSINAISIISGNSINDFSINITEISLNKKINKSTDDGSLILSAITGVYNVTIISDNFAYDSQTINILAADTLPNITFSLYTRNSINITIYDEETQKIINDTTTTLILNNLNSIMQTLYTSNGTIYKDDLFGGLWDIAVFNDFYTLRNYFVTIVDDTHTTLNVWLLNSSNGESKTFNIRNQEDEPLEDVFMTITNKVNDTFVVVAQKYSDISGQLSIFLKSTTEYRIMLEAAGYTTKIFNLEPASSLYNIILSTDVDIPFTTIYDKVSYSLTTTEGSLNFSIITSSTGGFISFFGLNSSFDGINYLTNVTGSVGGGTASIIILNSSNSTGRTIDIDYFIKLNGEDLINLHNTYYTYNATAISNYSALSVADKYKGDFSGVMLAVISILVVVAIVATFAELGVPAAISGFAGAIILFVFSILGWLPILMTSSILIIVIGMFLFRRGD
tara:strand:- start:8696 stop:11341 length:2646 start_codon:yes stop_codon:yes gene_type:complete